MKIEDIIKELDKISKLGRGCMCSFWESCENCSSFSLANRIRNEVIDLKYKINITPTALDPNPRGPESDREA